MIVIFEGHDMVGKTNIAQAVSKLTGIKVYKSSREKSRWWDPEVDVMYAMDPYIDMIELFRGDIIFDRFHGSSYAYGLAYDRPLSIRKIAKIDQRLADNQALIVYCYKTPAHYQPDDQGIIDESKYDIIKEYYEQFLGVTKCRVVRLCTDNEDLNSQVQTVMDVIGSITVKTR